MNVAEVLRHVDGLTYDKLVRIVRTGLIHPKGAQRGSMQHAEFSNKDLFLIKRTWNYLKELRMEERTAE